MPIARFILRRLGALVLTLLIASFAIYSLIYIAPGNVLTFVLGNRTTSPEQIAAAKERYHLDDPFLVRYWDWLAAFVRGDLGRSIVFNQDVRDLISTRLPTTVLLVAMASIIIVIVGIGAGRIAATRGGVADGALTVVATIGIATPAFVIAVAAISYLAVDLGWFPVFGSGSGLPDRLWHLTLPALTLAFSSAAYLALITRSSMLSELDSEHVDTARARGLSQRVIIRDHVFRNALIPIVTVVGLTIGTLIAGAVVIENVFALDGLGSLLVQAILRKDFAIVQAIVMILVAAFVIINTIADIAYALLDPRVDIGSGDAP